MSAHMKVLANDPSITAWGWAVVDQEVGEKGKVLEVGCIKTSPGYKKQKIRKGDDTTRRVMEINTALLSVIYKYNIKFLLSELPHGSQSAAAAVMIGIVTGIGQTLSDALGIPIEWYSEGDSKKNLLGKLSATKDETKDAISSLYKVPWTGVKYHDEAVADALAVYHVAINQSLFL